MKTIDEIKNRVAIAFNVTAAEIDGPSRPRHIVWPRQVTMLLTRRIGYSATEIGRQIGGRCHSAVYYGCQAVRDQMDVYPALRREVERLEEELV